MIAEPKIERAIQALQRCFQECERCAAGCLQEPTVADLRECIRLDLECAEACLGTARALLRDSHLSGGWLTLCVGLCETCAAECERHAHHERCRECAKACRACVAACREVLEA
jgi:hypothetical protein